MQLSKLRAFLYGIIAWNVHQSVASPLHHRRSFHVESFDFVIVGGGHAGLTLASRLTESSNITVLVLEAGQKPDEVARAYKTPGASQTVLGSVLDWSFTTAPQASLNNRNIIYHRGKGLGGSTLINGMIYGRGSSSIYDLWQDMGNEEWSWENVFPYFQKSATFVPSLTKALYETGDVSAYSDGPVQLTYPTYQYPASVAFIEALSSIGVPVTEELNTGSNVGAKQALMTMDATQQRSSAYDNYFMLAKERPNLTVRTLATVSQLIVEETEAGPSVTGVIYTDGLSGATTNVTATKEVIMSAGTFQTPQLLILSGIGPQRTLDQFGIMPYVVNNNIGQNLQDHTYFSVIARSVPETSASQLYNNITTLQAAEQQFNTTKTGPLTVPVGPNYGWHKLPLEKLEELNATELLGDRANQAHIEYLWENIYYPAGPSPDGLQYPPKKNESFFSITAGLVAPISKGNVSIMSNSIQDPPLINLNYLSELTDQRIAIQAFKNLRRILAQEGLARYTIGSNNGEVVPGINVDSDDEILDYIRNTAIPIWHVSGTCAMLPKESGGVVDSRLNVYGVKGLRIVDASIIPIIPDQHTMGPVYMIAEKAAVMIKEDWKLM